MNSIPIALVWQYWRNGRAMLLCAPLGMALLPIVVYSALWYEGMTDFQASEVGRMLHFSFLLMGLVFSGACVITCLNDSGRSFALPVSARMYVGCNMLIAIATAALLYIASALALDGIFGLGWPLLGPAAFSAAVIACLAAIRWSLWGNPVSQAITAAPILCGLAMWFGWRSRVTINESTTWYEVTLSDYAFLVGVCAVAYGVAVVGYKRRRQGEPVFLIGWLKPLWENWLDGDVRRRQFRDALAAQRWYEWRQRGFALPALAAATGVGSFVMMAMPWMNVESSGALLSGLTTIAIFVSPLLGMYIGHRSNNFVMGSFDATRPLTDRQLASAILFDAAKSVALTCVIWIAVFGIFAACCSLLGQSVFLSQRWQGSATEKIPAHWMFVIASGTAIVGSWALIGLGIAVSLCRGWLVWAVVNGGTILFMFVFLAISFFIPEVHHRVCLGICAGVLGSLIIVGVLVAFAAAWQQRLVTAFEVVASAGGWLLLVGAFLLNCRVVGFPPPLVILFIIGLCVLPVAPQATVRLAFRWSRRR